MKQIGFSNYAESFDESRVDGDLLLQLTEEMLRDDIGIKNGLLRRRFMRELTNLKRMADYSRYQNFLLIIIFNLISSCFSPFSCDQTNLSGFLCSIGQEFSVYTYDMLKNHLDRETMLSINEEQLLSECGIKNRIHRLKIFQGIKVERGK